MRAGFSSEVPAQKIGIGFERYRGMTGAGFLEEGLLSTLA
ncbi:hypothetical protein ACZ87_01396 [Candidatus Erwinia dacicola]|uniref:Uncharacterized protein n=1 Tax=Candidatus Erwinia dacicola TaxID=252393 RepID=A0A328TSA9_9GAMM|nr:hypothetical protein ACZ87_01396 [Candidatus Erwinia dacicola]